MIHGLHIQEPPIERLMLPEMEDRALRDLKLWPEGKPLPTHHQIRRQHPCPKCRRVLLDNLSQAVVCTSTGNYVAYFRCRASDCRHTFKLAVQRP